MNREVLEEQAKKIQERAKELQAGLQTMKNLQKCLVHGHQFDLFVEQEEFHEILKMGLRCSVCGAETELFENIALEMPDDEEKVGDLACLGLNEIDVEVPDEVKVADLELDEDAIEVKVIGSNKLADSNGTYKVDVSNMINKNKEESK